MPSYTRIATLTHIITDTSRTQVVLTSYAAYMYES